MSASTDLYFAFGMNLDPTYMYDSVKIGPAVLQDHELFFNHYAAIRPKVGAEVNGGLWKIDEKMLRTLDGREGFHAPGLRNMYERAVVTVETSDGPVEAFTYFPGKILALEEYPPDDEYTAMVARGYEHFGLPLFALIDSLWANAEWRADYEAREHA